MTLQLSQYPFLRIAIPLIAGILLFHFSVGTLETIVALVIAIVLYTALATTKASIRYRYQKWFVLPLFLAFTTVGWFVAYVDQPDTLQEDRLSTGMYFSFSIESIKHRNSTTEILATSNDIKHESKINLLVSIEGNDYHLRPGDIIHCHSKIERIKSATFPESFDYAAYMETKGFLYRTHIQQNNYLIIGHDTTLSTKAIDTRNKIIKRIQETGFNQQTTNFLITILTGDNRFVTEEMRESFANSGLSHILAVSGLHIGIIGLIISFFLIPLDRIRLRSARIALTILMIWAFTYMTGMAPSATRAAIMASFVFGALLLRQKHSIVNALCCSASLILIVNPSALFDMGFQLSYLSVVGILMFAHKMTFGKRFSIRRKLSAILSVSIAAQLGTAVITLHYFNLLPISFLIGNAIVVPLLPIYITIAIFTILISAFGLHSEMLVFCADKMQSFIFFVSDFSDSALLTPIDNVWIDSPTAILLYIAILLFGIWLNRPKPQAGLLYMAVLAIAGCTVLSIRNFNMIPAAQIAVSDGYTSTNIVYCRQHKAFIVNSKNDTAEINNFIERNLRFFIKNRIDSIVKITTPYSTSFLYADYPYIAANGTRFIFATGGKRNGNSSSNRIDTDYLILTGRYYNSIENLKRRYMSPSLIIPRELYDIDNDSLAQTAEKNGYQAIDITKTPFAIQFN